MKKIVLGAALVAAMVLGTTAYAQTPSKKEVKKEQTASVKKEQTATKKECKKECKKDAKATCNQKAEKAAPTTSNAKKK